MPISDSIKERIAQSLSTWVDNDLEDILADQEQEVDTQRLMSALDTADRYLSYVEVELNALGAQLRAVREEAEKLTPAF